MTAPLNMEQARERPVAREHRLAARTDPQEVIATLDALSRTRALTDEESLALEKAIKQIAATPKRAVEAGNFLWTEARDKRLFTMRDNGCTCPEIAEALGASVKTVEGRIYRLRKQGVTI